jgi:phosphoribosylamine--glycine ligase
MKRHDIPTAAFSVCDNQQSALAEIDAMGAPVVIKADGLAAGKGVVVALTKDEARAAIDEIMVEKKFGDSGRNVVIEECLEGFPSSQDHKRIFDGDKGPNTGGMGAYAPVPFVAPDNWADIKKSIVQRTLQGMEADGVPFSGVLYAGLMMTKSGPKVLEYNVRFGDPETQVLLPLVKSDLFSLLYEAAGGSLPDDVEFHQGRHVATVVMAAAGYPGSYDKGKRIVGLDEVAGDSRVAFHAGTADTGEGIVTSGGRVLSVTAWQQDLAGALHSAYEGVEKVGFSGAQWRKDIGRRALRAAEKTGGTA